MVKATILAEYRYRGKTVLLERVHGGSGNEYRVTLCRRFPSLAKAEEAFFPETPAAQREQIEKQIEDGKTIMHREF